MLPRSKSLCDKQMRESLCMPRSKILYRQAKVRIPRSLRRQEKKNKGVCMPRSNENRRQGQIQRLILFISLKCHTTNDTICHCPSRSYQGDRFDPLFMSSF